MTNKIITAILLIIISGTIYAHQIKAARDDATINVYISNKDYTRIFVSGDRIASIKGQQSLYEVKEFKDGSDEGVLYIRPTATECDLFSIFIDTELGHHFTLNVHLSSQDAGSIEIKPLSPVKKLAEKWEKNGDYTQTLIELMRAMVNNAQPEGYAVITLDKAHPQTLTNGLTLRLIKLYRGHLLRGEIWCIQNKSKCAITVKPQSFYKIGVRAASLTLETIKPCDVTYLYRIVSDE